MKSIKINKKDRKKVIVKGAAFSLCVTDIEEDNDMPTVKLELGKFHLTKCKSLNKMFSYVVDNSEVENIDVETYNTLSNNLTLSIIYNSNKIAIQNRRGSGNYIISNKKTLKKIKQASMFLTSDGKFKFEVSSAIPDNEMLIMYIGENIYDRFIYNWTSWFIPKYFIAIDKIKVDCKRIKIT